MDKQRRIVQIKGVQSAFRSVCASQSSWKVANFTMNKSFIILLAVCLVSVHAFVKREAETKPDETFDSVKKKVEDAFTSVSEGIKDMLNPEEIKKSFNSAVDSINKAITDLQNKQEGPKA